MFKKVILRPVKCFVEEIFGVRILKQLPRGLDFIHDVRPLLDARIIFDVGANIGQSAIPFAKKFVDADVHCFEPSRSTFTELVANTENIPSIHSHAIALSSTESKMQLVHEEHSCMHYLQDSPVAGKSTEPVQVTTLDNFCQKKSISRINILKVDTEGHDLKVLQGGERLLRDASIDVIYVEAGISPANEVHVSLDNLRDYLSGHGYLIFGFYEQVHEWKLGRPYLRRADVAFLSPDLAERML